jgi:hypothetical protein
MSDAPARVTRAVTVIDRIDRATKRRRETAARSATGDSQKSAEKMVSKKRRRLSRASSRRGTAVAAAVRAVEAMTVPGSEIDHLLFGASSRAPTPGTSPSRSPVVVVSSSDLITRVTFESHWSPYDRVRVMNADP